MRRKLFVAAAAVHLVIAALFSTHVRVENFLPWAIAEHYGRLKSAPGA